MVRQWPGEVGEGKGRYLGSLWDTLWPLSIGHLRVTMGHLRVTMGHLRVTMGHLRLTIGYLKATVVQIRVTLGHLRATLGHLSKHKAKTCLYYKHRQYRHHNAKCIR